jgi:hypothetical protein
MGDRKRPKRKWWMEMADQKATFLLLDAGIRAEIIKGQRHFDIFS